MSWWQWTLIVLAIWFGIGVPLGVFIGRFLRYGGR